MEPFESTTNPFGGILPNPDALPSDPETFSQQLQHSLDTWANEDHLLVWLEVPITKSAFIPIAVDAGFIFHHSADDYLMMTYQLDPNAYIPHHATHYIGAGGVVINERKELLVVSERYRRKRANPSYKLPGGALHAGEHLAEAVVREVYEETGVRAKFEGLVCFRHWHGYRFGKSDIYFICRLAPESEAITMQESEIEECLWMPVEEYLNSEFVHIFNKKVVQAALDSPGIRPMHIEGYDNPDTHEFFFPD